LAAITALRVSGDVPARASLVTAFLAALVASGQARLLARRRRESFHVLLVLGSLAAAVACRLVLPSADARLWWALAALLPSLLHLAELPLSPAPPRASAVAAALAVIVGALVWSLEPARDGAYLVTLAAGLVV